MKQTYYKIRYYLLLACSIFVCIISFGISSFGASPKNLADINLVASTPADEQIRFQLNIPLDTKVDFIRWNLFLSNAKAEQGTFELGIQFGESQPNTLGFVNGGQKKTIEGVYSINQYHGTVNGEIYHLKSSGLPVEMLIIKLTDNIFHLLNPQKQLMIGNGGWSYTLNRKSPLPNISTSLPYLTIFTGVPADTATQIIFAGRTPCREITTEKNLAFGPDCFKLKWFLILNKDPKTLEPSTYILKRTGSRDKDITGKWTIKRAIDSNSQVLIYQLDPDKPAQSISLFLGSENIAFFLHDNNEFYVGNEDFSYTLNREEIKMR
jgi:hypothetical protein